MGVNFTLILVWYKCRVTVLLFITGTVTTNL